MRAAGGSSGGSSAGRRRSPYVNTQLSPHPASNDDVSLFTWPEFGFMQSQIRGFERLAQDTVQLGHAVNGVGGAITRAVNGSPQGQVDMARRASLSFLTSWTDVLKLTFLVQTCNTSVLRSRLFRRA